MSASGGSILAKMKDGFRMHPQARVFDARGQVEFAPGPGGVMDERPSTQALAGAFGGPFRIGGAGALQQVGAVGQASHSCDSGRQDRRLIVPPLHQAPPVEGHGGHKHIGHQQRLRRFEHPLCCGLGKVQTVGVF